ncbi:hypothetical protein [Luteimonas viscosa]|uniref:hypothetical protein n=1 Tax=Luteimonas viscosa TaxID=1132694 RepID=UPI0021CC957E|nr:hypothetical protein [Luteimonas viscosa]
MRRHSRHVPHLPGVLCLVMSVAGCATAPDPAPVSGGTSSVEGTIASIDTRPWTYDGNAIVMLDVPGRDQVAVHLPARWNLCKAAPVDMDALAVGMRVRATGSSGEPGEVVVCEQASHGLAPVR